MKNYDDFTIGDKNKISRRIREMIFYGELVRPSICELCQQEHEMIFAHHANGYDKPFDVWWICVRCNNLLRGEKFHSNQVSIEEARQYIENYSPIEFHHEYAIHHFRNVKRLVVGEIIIELPKMNWKLPVDYVKAIDKLRSTILDKWRNVDAPS